MLELGVVTAFGSSRGGEGYSWWWEQRGQRHRGRHTGPTGPGLSLKGAAGCLKGAVADGLRRRLMADDGNP